MKVDLRLSNAEVYDVTSFRVLVGEAFALTASEGARWFADNDPALKFSVGPEGTEGVFIAELPGVVEIQLQRDGAVVKRLNIEVYTMEAATLGASAGEPVLK